MAREITTLEVDVWTIGERFKKAGQTHKDGGFTVACDEEIAFGGDGTAPWPLEYFLLSLAF